jgi:MFS family permease
LTVIYYTSQFGTLYFLTGTARVPETDALLYMAVGAALAAPTYVACGWLSDKWGRKRLLLLGYGLSIVGVFPIFWMMADAANPALARATERNPVTLSIPECDFNALNRVHKSECAQALNFLTKRGIAYNKQASDSVSLNVGDANLEGFDEKAYIAALEKAGYPDKSDPAQREPWKIILAVFLMVALSGMTGAVTCTAGVTMTVAVGTG